MAGRGTSVCLTLLCFAVLPFVSADQNIITKTGEMVSLPCRAPNNKIRVIEWRRPDLKPELVLVYRGGRLVLGDQHPSFKNRVDLQDRQMKDGNVSLIVKNVRNSDDGTYKCRVFMEETLSWEHISSITLSVVDPSGNTGGDTEDGSVGLKVGLPVFWLLVVAVAFVF